MSFATKPTGACLFRICISCIYVAGLAGTPYNTAFKHHRNLCVAILKRFEFGGRAMETRILGEVEEMIGEIRAQQGRPFDVKQLTTLCVTNVVMKVLFGRRFDRSNPEFQQLISDVNKAFRKISIELDMFPVLRILPYYKKKMADVVFMLERSHDFLKAKIAECRKVC